MHEDRVNAYLEPNSTNHHLRHKPFLKKNPTFKSSFTKNQEPIYNHIYSKTLGKQTNQHFKTFG